MSHKQRTDTITATFKNSRVLADDWTIKDGTTGEVIFDGHLDGREDPNNSVVLSLSAPDGTYGDACYKHSGSSNFTHRGLIENGDIVEM